MHYRYFYKFVWPPVWTLFVYLFYFVSPFIQNFKINKKVNVKTVSTFTGYMCQDAWHWLRRVAGWREPFTSFLPFWKKERRMVAKDSEYIKNWACKGLTRWNKSLMILEHQLMISLYSNWNYNDKWTQSVRCYLISVLASPHFILYFVFWFFQWVGAIPMLTKQIKRNLTELNG